VIRRIERAPVVTAALRTLALDAAESTGQLRGGSALVGDIERVLGVSSIEEVLTIGSRLDGLLVASEGADVVGFALVTLTSPRTLLSVYVAPPARHSGVARDLVEAARGLTPPVVDAWVLPGDRASKSLYESIRWRARRLTMSAGRSEDDAAT
jgi:GNAT superfamily N-acetyltransferase